MPEFILRRMEPNEWQEVADLIYASTNAWYMKNRGFKIFNGSRESTLLYCRVYEALDPGCTVIAVDTENGKIAASCFIHPRPTHISLGIMNVHPDYFGHGLSSRLLKHITDLGEAEGKIVRLVSSAMNLDSFSLYSKGGFSPVLFFQDMTMKVPDAGISLTLPEGDVIRDATQDDVREIVALEKELYHIEREKDFRYFIQNEDGLWRMIVYVNASGKIDGYVASVRSEASHMLGPGIARTEEQAIALIYSELDHHRGTQPVWLIPSKCQKVAQAMYAIGAKNCELHVAQVRGDVPPENGVVLPTFMPETC